MCERAPEDLHRKKNQIYDSRVSRERKKQAWWRREVVPYLHEAPNVLLLLKEVLVQSAPVGDQLEYLTLPKEGVFALLLAPTASAAISESIKEADGQ